jgi:tripartite motif-containing protein 2/3
MITQENKCPICLKLFNDPRWIPCKHIYCYKCIPRLHRRDLDTKDQIILECRICSMKHSFPDWSTVKYYVTLHCVPYLTALQFDLTSKSSTKSLCSACFNMIGGDLNVDYLEYCNHCNKMICHECLIDHRMELKKNILQDINQCRLFIRKNQQNAQQIMNKLENMKIHIDFCASELIDQVYHIL